jgi:hypothetical protein
MTVFAGTAVIPSSFQTDRQDVHALLIAIADAWISYAETNGIVHGLVRKRWHTLPEDLSDEGPFVYITEISERIVHDYGTRTTTFEGGLAYVDVLSDPEQTDDRVNSFADYMRDVFTANVETIAAYFGALGIPRSGMFEEISAQDEPPLHEGPYPFAHFVVRWRYVVQGGYR